MTHSLAGAEAVVSVVEEVSTGVPCVVPTSEAVLFMQAAFTAVFDRRIQ
jgi:hypothetical protein